MTFSKTSQPRRGLEERIEVFKNTGIEAENILHNQIPETFPSKVSKDDLIDALALAITASKFTGSIRTLPENTDNDPTGLPMEIVYSFSKE